MKDDSGQINELGLALSAPLETLLDLKLSKPYLANFSVGVDHVLKFVTGIFFFFPFHLSIFSIRLKFSSCNSNFSINSSGIILNSFSSIKTS